MLILKREYWGMLLGNISCKLHLLRRGQLHHCDQKAAFLFLDLKSGNELIFFSVLLQTDLV